MHLAAFNVEIDEGVVGFGGVGDTELEEEEVGGLAKGEVEEAGG